MKKTILAALLAVVTFSSAFAQDPVSAPSVQTVQPKIMVIPYTKEGEDIRTILESDVNKRIVLTKIKEAFDSRGFTTVDFTEKRLEITIFSPRTTRRILKRKSCRCLELMYM